MKAGSLEKAAEAFQQAFDQSDEPRFLFHLIVTRLAQNKLDEAKSLWQELDLDRLDPAGLTLSERKQLDSLTKDFGP